MDVTTIIEFFTGGSLIAVALVAYFKKAFEDVEARYGKIVTQLLLVVVCLLISLLAWAFQFIPAGILTTAGIIFMGATTLYQVAYKAIWQGLVKGNG